MKDNNVMIPLKEAKKYGDLKMRKIYFFYIIDNEVDVESDIVEYASCISMTVNGNTLIHKSENYSTIEEALDARDNEEKEKGKHYTYTPVMEGWIRE